MESQFGANTGVLRSSGGRIREEAEEFVKNTNEVYNTIDELIKNGYISDTSKEIAEGIRAKQTILSNIASTIAGYGGYFQESSATIEKIEGDISSETKKC